jgi:hypothetical protein
MPCDGPRDVKRPVPPPDSACRLPPGPGHEPSVGESSNILGIIGFVTM